MLVTGKKILDKANKGNYSVPAVNVNDMEVIQAAVRAAEKAKSPLIIQTSQGAIKYAGAELLREMVELLARRAKVPIALHLDHGRDMTIIKTCIKVGYTSIMFDGSNLSYKENIKTTKKVVSWAHAKGISVEGELGTIGGVEDGIRGEKILYTNPDDAVTFFKETGVDSLAIAIGTSHGPNKFVSTPQLQFHILKEIKERTKKPIVLHGASSVYPSMLAELNEYGGKMKKAIGVPDAMIRKAVKLGINKINTDTDLRILFTATIREEFKKHPERFDPRDYLGPAREELEKLIMKKMILYGSAGKA
ncbi:MAG: class II fructose-1,6-bisphosphate aldolase [Candidatus Woesearchaeota archaeon]|nr:MAG: class II fructose-1,6-bisphosphate aldolase [Candidatus Woesearchaeota archaeon]